MFGSSIHLVVQGQMLYQYVSTLTMTMYWSLVAASIALWISWQYWATTASCPVISIFRGSGHDELPNHLDASVFRKLNMCLLPVSDSCTVIYVVIDTCTVIYVVSDNCTVE